MRDSGLGVPDGWSVIMKTDGDTTFAYDSDYWSSTTNTLNERSGYYLPGNAKYEAYNSQPFDAIQACVGSFDNCLEPYAFAEPYTNAAELFAGEHHRGGVEPAEFMSVFGVSGHKDCAPQRPGFNTQCAQGNSARWGFCNNVPRQDCQTADSDDADGVIGFGLTGQDCCPMGAGWTNYFVNDAEDGGSESRQQAWIMVRNAAHPGNTGPGGQHFGEWTVVLKSDGDETFQYSSPLWGSDELLDPGSDVNSPGNAKYEAYNSQEFDAIKVCVSSGQGTGLQSANCIPEQAFLEPYVNSAALFDGPFLRQGVVQEEWHAVFNPSGHKESCGMQRPVNSDAFSSCLLPSR